MSALAGTNTSPSPSPCSTPVQISVLRLTSSVKPAISCSEKVMNSSPVITSTRGSSRVRIRRPTSIIENIEPSPRGASTSPVVTAG